MKQYLPYLDSIRFLAMFMVIICHACDPFNAGATYGAGLVDENMFFWGSVWGSLVRACVPLFVMLMGVLNLPTKWEMQVYWRKRILRVLWPFLIWSALYNMYPWILGLLGFPESTVHYFFAWASSTSQEFGECVKRVCEIPYKFDYLACHMWYIYMLIGLYLFMPILSAWVKTATKTQIEMVLGVWVISTGLPYLHEFCAPYLFGECDWSGFGTFYYFSGYTGYLLLGYYIVKYVPIRPTRDITFSVVAFTVGALVTYWGFRHMTSLPECTAAQTELFWTYCTPNVALMTCALFLIVRAIPVANWARPALANFTICGFGIYMIHYFFVGPTYDIIERLHLSTGLRVPAAAILILAISWGLVALAKRYMRHSRWLVG